MGGLLFQAFVYLCAAVIAVPIAKRLGLGSVLGYLIAGIVIGPVIGLVGSETQEILIPMLALIPLLALPELAGTGLEGVAETVGADDHGATGHHEQMSLVEGLPGWGHALVVLGAVALVLLGGHFGLARLFWLKPGDGWLFTLGLAQAGEFGFVLLSFSLQNSVIPADLAKTLSLVVALSMLLTPALFILYDRLIMPRLGAGDAQEPDTIDEQGTAVIAGMGRFGQIVNRLLVASDVRTVVLDHEAARIDMLRQVGIKSYYGDASRPELLHAAGIEHAKLFIVAIDDRDRAVEMVEHVRRHYPQVKILVRAFDVNHLYLLKKAGADLTVREMFDASLELGAEALKTLGMHPFKVEKMARAFRRHDEAGLDQRYDLWDENPDIARNRAFLARVKEHSETLKDVMEADRLQLHDRTERAWTPPPKGYTKELPKRYNAPLF